jgi:hypothetical protein
MNTSTIWSVGYDGQFEKYIYTVVFQTEKQYRNADVVFLL